MKTVERKREYVKMRREALISRATSLTNAPNNRTIIEYRNVTWFINQKYQEYDDCAEAANQQDLELKQNDINRARVLSRDGIETSAHTLWPNNDAIKLIALILLPVGSAFISLAIRYKVRLSDRIAMNIDGLGDANVAAKLIKLKRIPK